MINAIGAYWGCVCPILSRLGVKTLFFSHPPITLGFGQELDTCTYLFSENPDCELQDTPIIRAIRGSDGCIYKVQSRLGVKTHHFDGLVRVSLMSLTTNESSTCTVFENTIKSEIGFILASLHHFLSNSCDFCSVRHLLCSWFLMLWKALNNLDNWY